MKYLKTNYAEFPLSNLAVSRKTSGNLPSVSYEEIKNAILGKKYELDISFIPTQQAIDFHIKYKKKGGPANILSFPYSDKSGEITLHLGTLRTQAKIYEKSYENHLIFMLIHGMLHLKGFDHGEAMEKQEQRFYRKYKK